MKIKEYILESQQTKEYDARYIGKKVKVTGGNFAGREGVIRRTAGFSGLGPKFMIDLSSTRNPYYFGAEVVISMSNLEIKKEDE